ncbi:PKD domain-containing protein [Desulfosediminicola flagellatus]|uniref:PKD domain-containing protein n=1 Tax=Desulfosediminicola flagellatus TaxID=2569541 RepID=UPI0010AC3201|nr:PKD domain-containing protein [Desulfosediminicola flagellatus]
MRQKTLFLLSFLFLTPAISIGAELRNLDVQFAFTAPNYPTKQLRGYQLYMDGQQVCSTNDPTISRITCQISTQADTGNFTLTAYYSDGSESPPSPSFPLTFDSPSVTPTAVVSTSTAAGYVPLTVSFNGSYSSDPDSSIVSYSWKFGDGTQASGVTASHVYTTAGIYDARLTVVDSQGLSDSATTPIVVAEGTSAGADGTTDPVPDIGGTTIPETILFSSHSKFEVGSLSINDNWVRVLFKNSYNQPIVIAGPPTVNGWDPCMVRIRNINQDGFDIHIQEWDYLDGSHALETVSYMVMEKGVYTLDNGSRIEAGRFNSSTSFQQVALQQAYNLTPVIITQVMTETGGDAVTNRLSDIGQTSFKHKLQEQQLTQTDHPAVETIGYIAVEPGIGQEVDGLLLETSLTPNKVDHNWLPLTYKADFSSQPFFFAGMQTTYGDDTAAVRTTNISPTGTEIKVEEEQSNDTEITHAEEVMGYFSIGTAN